MHGRDPVDVRQKYKNMKTICLFYAIIALSAAACSKTAPEKLKHVKEESVQTNELPIAMFPKAKLQIEKKGEGQFWLSIDFTKWPNGPEWNRARFGINSVFHDAKLEYLGHSEKGDGYKITILQPYPENLNDHSAVPIAYKEEVSYEGNSRLIYEVDGVTYTLTE